jgi:DNA-directed RNA polymerase specialized sigma24 family protein
MGLHRPSVPPEGMPPLVREAQRGDAAAMDELMRALAPYVGRVCGAIALDRGDDAMQETFIAVLRHLRSLREPAALHGWVRRIAVREALRAAGGGAGSGRATVATAPGDLAAQAAPVPLPDLDTVLDVRAALAELAPRHRAVLVLRDLDGLSEAEVAGLLDVPEGTVKSRLHRARAAAREVLSR